MKGEKKKKRICKAGNQTLIPLYILVTFGLLLPDEFGKMRKSKGQIRLCILPQKRFKTVSESKTLQMG
jgi:hypothetical protein